MKWVIDLKKRSVMVEESVWWRRKETVKEERGEGKKEKEGEEREEGRNERKKRNESDGKWDATVTVSQPGHVGSEGDSEAELTRIGWVSA